MRRRSEAREEGASEEGEFRVDVQHASVNPDAAWSPGTGEPAHGSQPDQLSPPYKQFDLRTRYPGVGLRRFAAGAGPDLVDERAERFLGKGDLQRP